MTNTDALNQIAFSEPRELRMESAPRIREAFKAVAAALYANGWTPEEVAALAAEAAKKAQ